MSTDLSISFLHAMCVVWMMCVILHKSVITQVGYSALIWVARSGYTEVIVELVKANANLDLQNEVN